MVKLENRLGYKFKEIKNLKVALTHSSYIKEENLPRWLCNERLEFLGDGILEAIICEVLFRAFPEEREGKMAKLKSDIVRAITLTSIARELYLGEYLILGKGEELYGGREKDNILADALEAIIGAIFIESGYEVVKQVVLSLFKDKFELAYKGDLDINYKSALQELLHKRGITDIKYVLMKEEGKSHEKVFYVDVLVSGVVIGRGIGKSKKTAENEAAKEGLNLYKKDF